MSFETRALAALVHTGLIEEERLKELIGELHASSELRNEAAKSPELWHRLAVTIAAPDLEPSLYRRCFQLVANISAVAQIPECTADAAAAVSASIAGLALKILDEPTLLSMWSAIANLARAGFHPLANWGQNLGPAVVTACLLPRTHAVAAAIAAESQTTADLCRLAPAYAEIFLAYERWFESSDPAQERACAAVLESVARACNLEPVPASAPEFWALFDANLSGESISTSAMCVLDAALSCGDMKPPLGLLAHNFRSVAAFAIPMFANASLRCSDNALLIHARLNACTRSLTAATTELIGAESARKYLLHEGILEIVCDLLAASQSLPVRSKLTMGKAAEQTAPILDMHDFPYTKTNLLSLVTALVAEGGPETRDIARESGALSAVLSCCGVDENNPGQRERAIVAVRCLLANSPMNQAFVAGLEAKGVADPKALEAAGMEIELGPDGKPHVKQRPRIY